MANNSATRRDLKDVNSDNSNHQKYVCESIEKAGIECKKNMIMKAQLLLMKKETREVACRFQLSPHLLLHDQVKAVHTVAFLLGRQGHEPSTVEGVLAAGGEGGAQRRLDGGGQVNAPGEHLVTVDDKGGKEGANVNEQEECVIFDFGRSREETKRAYSKETHRGHRVCTAPASIPSL